MERAVLLCQHGEISAQDLGLASTMAEIRVDDSFRAAKARLVEAFERDYVEQALARSRGNIGHAAAAAKKNRRAFFELMRKYSIKADTHGPKAT